MLLVVAVAVLPLAHTGHARADAPVDGAAALCSIDACGCCPSQTAVSATSCCTPEDGSDEPAPCDDRPCDCPCCGKVLQVVSMISSLPMSGLFWEQTPAPVWAPHPACPDSAVVGVDIQPPIR